MKKKFFFLLAGLAACAAQNKEEKAAAPVYVIETAAMARYMELLPRILEEARAFLESPAGKASAQDPDNGAFYRYLYTNPKLAENLRTAGFPNAQAFGVHHEYIVALYLKIGSDQEIVRDAESTLPAMRKEKDALILKRSRDKNNASLEKLLGDLEEKEAFYSNVLAVSPYMKRLDALNKGS